MDSHNSAKSPKSDNASKHLKKLKLILFVFIVLLAVFTVGYSLTKNSKYIMSVTGEIVLPQRSIFQKGERVEVQMVLDSYDITDNIFRPIAKREFYVYTQLENADVRMILVDKNTRETVQEILAAGGNSIQKVGGFVLVDSFAFGDNVRGPSNIGSVPNHIPEMGKYVFDLPYNRDQSVMFSIVGFVPENSKDNILFAHISLTNTYLLSENSRISYLLFEKTGEVRNE
ncbi:MAG: hypothetical protein J4428_05395 [Candidatus Aenigmarchaeota archaeon]|nr:hypothetical protein [Candidatus Aenigmarchaeota archaeon]